MYNYLLAVAAGLVLLLGPQMGRAQSTDVIEWGGRKMLNTYLVQQLHRQYDIRRQQVQQAMQSPQGLRAYQDELRRDYRQLLGALPEKAPLEAKVTGTLQQDDYRIEKVWYQSFPGHHVTANLYVPQGKGPFPGVLLFCGHEATAKATPSYQQTAILLARHGFEVLMIDPVSQGERHQLTGNNGKPLTRGGTTEHTLLNAAAALVGSSVAAYELWDNERGLDYLLSRKEVDTARIACLGNSGGGTQAAYFMAFEPRIKVAAVCSYITTRERTFELAGPLDGCVQLPNEGKLGLEIADYMHMLAPKPLLVLAGRYDFVDYTGAELAYEEAKQCYAALGAAAQLKMVTIDDGHGISQPKREAAVQWFRKWLYGDDQPIKEAPAKVLPPATLFCTATGEVNGSIPGEVTVQQHLLQTASALAAKRRQFQQQVTGKAFADTLRQLLGISTQRAPVQVEETDTFQHAGYAWQKILLRSAQEPPLPFLLIRPQGRTTVQDVWICLHDDGKRAWLDSVAFIRSCLQKGQAVLLPDLRGTGETADLPAFNHPKFYNKEYRNAIASLHMGRPLPGQRVTDLLLLLDYLQADAVFQQATVRVKASGSSVLTALHAAVIDERISQLQANREVPPFTDMIRNVMGKDHYSAVIPRVLQYYDVPDLLRIVDKRFAFP